MTLVFLDHSFHQKTRSSDFFLDAWRAAGWDISLLYDDAWQGGPGVSADEVRARAPDLVISWQVLKPADFYRSLGCSHVLLVPMYDSARGMKPWDWWEYRQFSFLHFSLALLGRLTRLGIQGSYLQYFPDPAVWEPKEWTERTGDVFYWHRRNEISPTAIVDFVKKSWTAQPCRLHWHQASDPGVSTELPNSTGIEVATTSWFPNKDAYQTLVANHRVFIAPRLAEGIGVSFLEAMALGCVVVGNREATMNEYVVDGQNGILVKWHRPKNRPIEPEHWREMGQVARESVVAGRVRYEERLEHVLSGWRTLSRGGFRWTAWGLVIAAIHALRQRIVRPMKALLRRGR